MSVAPPNEPPTREQVRAALPETSIAVSLPESLRPVQAPADLVKAIVALLGATQKLAGAPSKAAGRFAVLLVTPSAPRAASLCGLLSRAGLKVAKLFARHLTVDEQAAFLSTHAVDVAVGTPNRLCRLCRDGLVDLSALRYVLVDSAPDAKQQTIFSPAGKGKGRRPDAAELAALLTTGSFVDRLLKPRAPVLCPVVLPTPAALEAATPVSVRLQGRGRGRGRGGRRGGGAAIKKARRPKGS